MDRDLPLSQRAKAPARSLDMLRHLYVLEYQDGCPEPWHAVHPLVERCRKLRAE